MTATRLPVYMIISVRPSVVKTINLPRCPCMTLRNLPGFFPLPLCLKDVLAFSFSSIATVKHIHSNIEAET